MVINSSVPLILCDDHRGTKTTESHVQFLCSQPMFLTKHFDTVPPMGGVGSLHAFSYIFELKLMSIELEVMGKELLCANAVDIFPVS